jgi:hypothetical protein
MRLQKFICKPIVRYLSVQFSLIERRHLNYNPLQLTVLCLIKFVVPLFEVSFVVAFDLFANLTHDTRESFINFGFQLGFTEKKTFQLTALLILMFGNQLFNCLLVIFVEFHVPAVDCF